MTPISAERCRGPVRSDVALSLNCAAIAAEVSVCSVVCVSCSNSRCLLHSERVAAHTQPGPVHRQAQVGLPQARHLLPRRVITRVSASGAATGHIPSIRAIRSRCPKTGKRCRTTSYASQVGRETTHLRVRRAVRPCPWRPNRRSALAGMARDRAFCACVPGRLSALSRAVAAWRAVSRVRTARDGTCE
jgi:hypothetical protein